MLRLAEIVFRNDKRSISANVQRLCDGGEIEAEKFNPLLNLIKRKNDE